MIPRWVALTIIYIVCEMIIAFAFSVLAQLLYKRLGFDFKSIIKGVAERLFLVVCLLNGYNHGLTLFGALKLGTRLKRNDDTGGDDKRFNDYYLLGNLISVSIAIGYVALLKNIEQIGFLNAVTR